MINYAWERLKNDSCAQQHIRPVAWKGRFPVLEQGDPAISGHAKFSELLLLQELSQLVSWHWCCGLNSARELCAQDLDLTYLDWLSWQFQDPVRLRSNYNYNRTVETSETWKSKQFLFDFLRSGHHHWALACVSYPPAAIPTEAAAFPCLASGPVTGTATTWQFQLQQMSQTGQNKYATCYFHFASACSKLRLYWVWRQRGDGSLGYSLMLCMALYGRSRVKICLKGTGAR